MRATIAPGMLLIATRSERTRLRVRRPRGTAPIRPELTGRSSQACRDKITTGSAFKLDDRAVRTAQYDDPPGS